MMLTIGLKVSSIMPETLTVLVQVLPILMKLAGIGLLPLILTRLLPFTMNHVFVLLGIQPVGPAILGVAREVAMIFTKLLLVLLHLAPCTSRFRGSLTKFGFGEDGLSGDRSANEHYHRHTHLYDMSVPHAHSLSLDRELLDARPILRSIAITSRLAEVDDRFRQASLHYS
jgi:hypothetical protein